MVGLKKLWREVLACVFFIIIIFCFFIFIPAGNCTTGDARLVNGSTRYEGTVQVCIGGVWGTVCDTYWSENDGRVVCRQLGYSTAGKGDIRLHEDDYYRALTQNNNIVFFKFFQTTLICTGLKIL